jgi:antitoxin PrlF
MCAFIRVNAKGQMTIPKAVRDALSLAPGAKLEVIADGGRVVAVPQNPAALQKKQYKIDDLIGILGKPPNGRHLSLEEIDEAIMDAVAEDDERIQRDWRQSRADER